MIKKLGILAVAFAACMGKNNIAFTPDFETPAPPALVYKTKADYANRVPVLLSEDKTEIIAYPHPADLRVGEAFLMPTTLEEGYLLDNKGIGANVAFLSYTYEEYSKLPETPALKELYNKILDKDPLTELCNCGSKKALTDPEKQLNSLVKEGKLRTVCKVVK
jgi:hypothetical protein